MKTVNNHGSQALSNQLFIERLENSKATNPLLYEFVHELSKRLRTLDKGVNPVNFVHTGEILLGELREKFSEIAGLKEDPQFSRQVRLLLQEVMGELALPPKTTTPKAINVA